MGLPAVKLGNGSFIAPGPEWDEMRETFRACSLDDIYYDHRYVGLYEGADGAARAFVYRHGRDLFFMPFLQRALPGDRAGLHDFETAYGYGGPVATTEEGSFLDAAWREFSALGAAKGLVAGFLRFHPLLRTERFARDPYVRLRRDRQTVSLALDSDYETVHAGYANDNRWRIRKGHRSGVMVDLESGRDSLIAFADLYRSRMVEIDAHESYLFDDDYFRRIDGLGETAYRVYFARLEGQAIGGALILFSNRYCHYHLSGCLQQYFKVGPYNMLLDGVIRDVLKKQWGEMHFGGGRTADPADSLLRFKRAFSKRMSWFYNGTMILQPAAYRDICETWRRNDPDKARRYDGRVLMYRY